MFTTHIESFTANVGEMLPIFDIHYKELSEHYKRDIPLEPDYERYKELEQEDKLLYIALRYRGELVGYFSGFVGTALHYKSCLTLSLDLFYVLPNYRGRFEDTYGGKILLSAVKKEAKRRGVKAWTMGRKARIGKHFGKLLLDEGFEPFEIHFVCWLDDDNKSNFDDALQPGNRTDITFRFD